MSTEAQFIISAKERTKPAFNQIKRNLQTVEKQSQRTQSAISQVMAPLSAYAAFAGVRRLASDFGNFEEALVKVGKTANIEGAELKQFGEDIKNLDIPVATNDLLQYAEAAGQLGIKGNDNLLKFVDTMARLEKSSDLAGEASAKSIARVINVTGEGIGTVDKFGSVLVALGNNFAASESEILGHTTEVSRAIAVYDVGSAQSAAFGTSMASLGIRAESGGSVVGRAFNSMNVAIAQGGEKLNQLMAITSMTEQQLKATFKDNAEGVFQSFLTGLNKIDKSGGDMIATLEDFGLKGEEVNKTLPVMAKNSGILARAMKLANKEVKDATALVKESNTAFQTMNADLVKTQKSLSNVSSEIGERLSPAITGTSSELREWIGDTDDISSSIDTLSNVAMAGLVGVTAKYTTSIGIATQAKIADIVATNNKIKASQLEAAQKVTSTKTEHAYALAVYNSAKAQKLGAIGSAKYTAAAKLEQTARAGLTTSIKAMQVAQSQHNAVMAQGAIASRALTGSMALLGGPAGIVMLAAGALTYFVSSSSKASENTQTLSSNIKALEGNYRSLSQAKLKGKIVELTQDIKTQSDVVKQNAMTILGLKKTTKEVWDPTLHQTVTKTIVRSKEEQDKLVLTVSAQETENKKLNQQLALRLQLEDQLKFLSEGGQPETPKKDPLDLNNNDNTDDPNAALKRQQLEQQYTDLQNALKSEDQLLFETANKRNVLLAELWQAGVITDAAKFNELASANNEQYLAKLEAIEAQEIAKNQASLIRLDEQWLTKSEAISAQHTAEIAQYKALFDKKTITETEYEERKKKLSEKYKKKHKKLEEAEQKAKFNMITGGLQTIANMETGGSKKLFKIKKAAALAQAAVSLPAAVIESFKNAGGYPWGIAPAAAMLASGLMQIKNIKSQTLGSSTSSSSALGGGSLATSIPSNTNQSLENTLSSNINSNNQIEQEPVRNYFIVEGDLIGNSADLIFDQIKEKIETTDAVLIEPSTRQAQELSTVGT